MFSPRWNKVIRDLWVNKTRTILVVLSIAVGVFAVGTVAHMQVIVSDDLNQSYAVCADGITQTQRRLYEHPPQRCLAGQSPPHRRELDKVVFKALGLTEGEQLEVYRAVVELVKNRLAKAGSV